MFTDQESRVFSHACELVLAQDPYTARLVYVQPLVNAATDGGAMTTDDAAASIEQLIHIGYLYKEMRSLGQQLPVAAFVSLRAMGVYLRENRSGEFIKAYRGVIDQLLPGTPSSSAMLAQRAGTSAAFVMQILEEFEQSGHVVLAKAMGGAAQVMPRPSLKRLA